MSEFHERNIVINLSNKESYKDLELIGKALSTNDRIKILNLLTDNSMSIVEISSKLNLAVSSTAFHIKCLEDAGLVLTHSQAGIRGSMRVCISNVQSIHIICDASRQLDDIKTLKIEMPIGNFYDCNVFPTCGLADENSIISVYDNPGAFYSPEKVNAQLIWFQKGFLEYRFPNHMLKHVLLKDLSFQLEICSEAPGFRDIWPSDISIIVNDNEVATYTCPGDFGSRLGKLTPKYWGYGSTQFGLLKTFSIRENGCYIDEVLVNNQLKISQIDISEKAYISFKICIKDNAKHIGGVNIFGKKFGDFNQDIIMQANYQAMGQENNIKVL